MGKGPEESFPFGQIPPSNTATESKSIERSRRNENIRNCRYGNVRKYQGRRFTVESLVQQNIFSIDVSHDSIIDAYTLILDARSKKPEWALHITEGYTLGATTLHKIPWPIIHYARAVWFVIAIPS